MSDKTLESTFVGPLLQSFFTEHMLSHRRASQQTVDSYRDTFRLLLRFLQQTTGKEPARLRIADLDAPAILNFLDHVEQQRKNQIQSRNVRLAAIRSFFRLVAFGILKLWLDASPAPPDSPAFPSARGATLSRDGVNYILQSAVREAAKTGPSLTTKRVSPHVLRHTTAMHLLQSGIDITIIALWLGHESPETTQVYVEADLKTKEQALQNVAPAGKGFRRFQPSDALLTFLDNL